MNYRNRIVETRLVPADELRRNPRNHRRHPDAQRTALRSLLGSVGVVKSLTAFEHPEHGLTLLDGEARWEEGGTWPVEIVDLSPDEADLALAMLDRIGAQAEIDPAALLDLLNGMDAAARATASSAWDDATLLALVGEQGLPEPGAGGDEFDPTPEDGPTRAQPGDLWVIGPHRLIVGDCTDPAVVERVMDGGRAALVVTSPPYWVGKEYEQESGRDEIIAHIERATCAIACLVGEHPHIAINTGTTTETHQGGDVRRIYLLLDWWSECFAAHGIYLRNLRIWAKHGNFIPYSPAQDVVDLNWEFLASFTKAKPRSQNRVDDRWALDGVWDCQPQTVDIGHSAPYPVEIPSRYMMLYTDKGSLVFDGYLGSGTTIIAAHRTGRRCYGCEIEPRYADVILRRCEAEGLTCERA